jgi:hypothetical protein
LGDNVAAKGGLDEFEFVQREPGDPSVIGMFDLTVLAKGGADQTVIVFAVGLDFEVEIGWSGHSGYIKLKVFHNVKINTFKCMATIEM